ncbi:MAG: hypothetical protein FJX34_04860, partial [Alphaproteobacteria bacterium]|nr:hypothetical protein [Alphaproteobacteria bacterium]
MNKTSLLICALIFLLSIFLRSQIDIGPDTGIYLDLGKKVVEGKRYYYDFFESNFPISFYFYALEYRLSTLLHINPIILSDIIINLLALLSIFWSARILRRGGIKSDLIIIGFFLGFFLRVRGLSLGEFGTKTSLLLLLLFPYISYSLVSEKIFTKRDLIWRGCLMGLMPCVKPHYLIFLLVIESYKFWQTKSPQFFLELDKLLAAAIYLGYLVWIIWFLPEFFEFMVPMWGKAYASYDSLDVFWGRCLRILASHVLLMGFVLLIFSRIRPSHESKILILFFVAASLLFVVENAITIDQSVIFYAVVTVCILRFVADLLASKKIILAENKFIFGALFLIPAFDLKALPTAVFGLAGFVNIWWVLALFVLPKIE